MIIRRTRIEDLENVMFIYGRAASYMAQTGNPNQWQVGYPTREMIMADITRGVSYVLDVNGVIEAVFSYIEGIDPTYGRIENGTWRSNGRYGTIHRIASAGRMRDVGSKCFAWCENEARMHGCTSLRVDTHQDNRIMQRVIAKNGFAYCGVIRLQNGAPRLAFEKVLWYKGKDDGIALGVLSMIFGVISLLLFCTCINYVLAIVSIILGIIQMVKNKDKALAVVGIVTSVISIILSLFLYGIMIVDSVNSELNYYDDGYYEEYFDDEYNDENYFDEYFESGEGAEFL